MTTPTKLYIFSERQLAEAFDEWLARNPPLPIGTGSGAARARYLLALLAELATNYVAEQ